MMAKATVREMVVIEKRVLGVEVTVELEVMGGKTGEGREMMDVEVLVAAAGHDRNKRGGCGRGGGNEDKWSK